MRGWLFAVGVLYLALLCTVLYVVGHFVAKYW